MSKESIRNHLLKDIKVSTIYSGIKKTQNNEDDLLLIELKKKSAIAGVFTQSLTSSASVNQCKKRSYQIQRTCSKGNFSKFR